MPIVTNHRKASSQDKSTSSRRAVGLVLGSGASRGWAHIGAIQALEEANIPIDCIAGSSIGSYVGAIYASGNLRSLKDFVISMDGKKVFSYFDIVLPWAGLLDGTKRLKELFSIHTDAIDFADLNIPVAMVATDLDTGGKVVLKSGSLIEALRATMSIPGIFAPARVKNRWLVDGGVVDPVPVGVARAMGADVVVAVDLNGGFASRKKRKKEILHTEKKSDRQHKTRNELTKKWADFYKTAGSGFKDRINELLRRELSTPDIVETVTTSIRIMENRITRMNLAVDPADILIQPRLRGLKMLDFDHVEHTIEEGYIGAKEKIEDIKNMLESI
jgi:NTE family protein